MIKIYPNLYIGTEEDYEYTVKHQDGWCVVHACKEPYHRRELGYKGRGAPKTHPEYLFLKRGNRLILNLVDVDDPSYISKEIIDTALDFINRGLSSGHKVLVHCNLGESRSPSIGLLYLAAFTNKIPSDSLQEAEATFRSIYPLYNPKRGIRIFLNNNWRIYCKQQIKNEDKF